MSGILNQNLPTEGVLHSADIGGAASQHFIRARNGQQIWEATTIETRPGQVLRNESWLKAIDEALESGKMVWIGFGSSGQGHPDAMKRELALSADFLEHCQARTAGNHVILGVNLEPKSRRRRGEGLVKMLGLEA